MIFISDEMVRIQNSVFDETYKDLLRASNQLPETKERSKKQILAYYQGVTKDGVVKFITPSGTTPGTYWVQRIKLLDLPKFKKRFKRRKPKDIVVLSMKGDIKQECNCPAYLYWGHAYKSYVNGYGLMKETRYPSIRNPQLSGSGCKHLVRVQSVLMFHVGQITRDLKSKGFFT